VKPRLSQLALLSLALPALVLLVAPLVVSAAFGLRRVDLFHAVVFNACALRSYDLHWQHPQRVPPGLSYDFVKIPDSFVLVEVWFHDGPTLSFSQRLPQNC
jgi:hypothetical protein